MGSHHEENGPRVEIRNALDMDMLQPLDLLDHLEFDIVGNSKFLFRHLVQTVAAHPDWTQDDAARYVVNEAFWDAHDVRTIVNLYYDSFGDLYEAARAYVARHGQVKETA